MINMYKLIGTDFDGTLLDDNSKVSEENFEYLKKARNKGIVIAGVTGRTLESVKKDVDINMFDYLILNNGATIYDVLNEKVLINYEITNKEVDRIAEFIDIFANQFDYCSFNKCTIYKNVVDHNDLPHTSKLNSIDELKEPISMINIVIKPDIDIYVLYFLISSEFPDLNVRFIYNKSTNEKWIVISPKNINKGEALRKLGEFINIKLDEMVFFGDESNDIEALEAVGMGVAMENASKEVKLKAKTYTKNNNDSGIAYFIKSGIL